MALAKIKSGDFIYKPVGPDKQRAERRSQFRRVGVIHEDYRYEAMLRNISRTGALIEGLLNAHVELRSEPHRMVIEYLRPIMPDAAVSIRSRHDAKGLAVWFLVDGVDHARAQVVALTAQGCR